MSVGQCPPLSQSVPVYSEKSRLEDIITEQRNNMQQYYRISDGFVNVIAASICIVKIPDALAAHVSMGSLKLFSQIMYNSIIYVPVQTLFFIRYNSEIKKPTIIKDNRRYRIRWSIQMT
ncbi:hypothetical protein G9A89_022207 [Geosiphon pyriformis]|nr:hypothetical protein G9A89_022207 [Geosiphon pyriformis]